MNAPAPTIYLLVGYPGTGKYTVAPLSPPGWSFVFTNWIGENESGARDYLERLRAIAGARASEFVIVRLVCETAELTTRVATPQRRERMKWTDAAAVLR
ncbi:MAG TPA: hypothetical protein VMY88_00005, partial [Acidimicrobiales bacterium]|nr:hypothetical protein [Acidimicrobiales bacterium]